MKTGSLEERLKKKTEENKRLIEDAERQIRETLTESFKSLNGFVQCALHTTKKDMERTLRLGWIQGLILAMAICAGIFAGSWGLTRFLTDRIRDQVLQIKQYEIMLKTLESKTGGLGLQREPDGSMLIILPPGWTANGSWKSGKYEAVHVLKSRKVKDGQ